MGLRANPPFSAAGKGGSARGRRHHTAGGDGRIVGGQVPQRRSDRWSTVPWAFASGAASTGEDSPMRLAGAVPDSAALGSASEGARGQRHGDHRICRGRIGAQPQSDATPACAKVISAKLDDVGGVGPLFTPLKVKAHQTQEAMDARQGDELAAFSADDAADLAATCSTEMERGKVMSGAHSTIRQVLLVFSRRLRSSMGEDGETRSRRSG